MAIDRLKAFKFIPKLEDNGKDLISFLNIVGEFVNQSNDDPEKLNFLKYIIKSNID